MPVPTLHNLDHLHARHVAELVRNAAWPSVTLLLDTQPADRMTAQDRARLQQLADDAERQLTARGAIGASSLVAALRARVRTAAESPTGPGLVILVNRGLQRSYRLPGPVPAMAVVERTFRTRELLQTLHRTPPHLLLLVQPFCFQLYRVYADTMAPLSDEGFPLQLTAPTRGGLEAGEDRSEDRLTQLDRRLGAARRRHPSPIIVAGEPDLVQRLLRRGRHLQRLAGVLTGPEVNRPDELYLAAKASLEEYLRTRQEEALLLLEDAQRRRPGTIRSGVEQAWRAAAAPGRPLVLLVEEQCSFPAVVDERGVRRLDWMRSPESVLTGLHTDLVDDLIEVVIDKGGWVAFTDDGALGAHHGVALVMKED